MKKLTMLILVLIAATGLHAQRLFLEYNLGYGTFSMSSMRHTFLEQEEPVKGMKLNDDFPGKLTQDVKAGLSFYRWDAGVEFGYLTTAAKKSLTDYSGKYKNEIRNKGFKTGIFARYCMIGQDFPLKMYAQLSAGTIFTKSRLTEKLNLPNGGHTEMEEVKLKTTNLYLQPALVIQYHIIQSLAIQAQIGYEWDVYKGKKYYEPTKTNVKADWDGLRASIGLVVYLTN